MTYRLEYTKAAEKFIRKLDRETQSRILSKLESVAEAPRGMGTVKLSGHNAYRVRVGDYRIIYSILDERLVIVVVEVGHRRDIYRDW